MLVIFLYTIFVVIVDVLFFFFFKQKTAYELRISDWSSDVCSSDLLSSCSLMMPSQAVLQAPVEPGMQNISVLLAAPAKARSEEHTSELQSLMRISYAVFCLKKKKAETIKSTCALTSTSRTAQSV